MAQGPFTETAQYLWNDYLSIISAKRTGNYTDYSYLIAPNHTIFVQGGYWEKFYVEYNNDLVLVKLHPQSDYVSSDAKSFYFYKADATEEFESGAKIYYRKDSYYHDWFVTDKEDEHEDFLHDEKQFVYLGKIYPVDNTGINFEIKVRGMDDFAIEALPEHNRTDNLKELFYQFFDKVHHGVYTKTKMIWSLLDPDELPIKYIDNIVDMYSLDVSNIDFSTNSKKRSFVKSIISLLKRRGTYDALYIIYKIFSDGTLNDLNIYDRWHDRTIPSNTPLPYFEDHLYTVTPSAAYPSKILSPHYKIEVDLSTEPIEDSVILSEDLFDNFIYGWELIRPVSRVAHYYLRLDPEATFTGDDNYLYTLGTHGENNVISRCYKEQTVESNSALHVQTTANAVWIIDHNLGTQNLLIQIFDSDREEMRPLSVEATTPTRVKVTFNSAQSGYALIREATYSGPVSASDSWIANHFQNSKVLSQFFDNSYYEMEPETVTIITDDRVDATFSINTTGRAQIEADSYQHTQSSEATTWNINHSLDRLFTIGHFYDGNWNKIKPTSFTISDADNAIATFAEATSGYGLFVPIANSDFPSILISSLIGGTFKIGSHETKRDFAGITDIGTLVWESTINSNDITEDSSWYYITKEVPRNLDFDFTEIALLDNTDDIVFYTWANHIYKTSDARMKLVYKISKSYI